MLLHATKSKKVDNWTNANSENIYSTMKRNPSNKKVHILEFIEISWDLTLGLRRQWFQRTNQGVKDEQDADGVLLSYDLCWDF